jgi:hypothetical protein
VLLAGEPVVVRLHSAVETRAFVTLAAAAQMIIIPIFNLKAHAAVGSWTGVEVSRRCKSAAYAALVESIDDVLRQDIP